MPQPNSPDYLSLIVTIATPIVVLLLTGFGWIIRTRNERIRELEAKLRDERIDVYFQILEPYFIALSNTEVFTNDKALKGKNREQLVSEKILSLEYKKAAFKLSLLGSDNVVRAFNDLMQSFYHQEGDQAAFRQIGLLGNFLLEVRKGVGNETTSLKKIDMLEWLITDIRQHKEQLD